MTPRERVEIALHGEHSTAVPFTIYESKIPQCAAEREMRNRGMCIVNRVSVFNTQTPNVKVTSHVYWENGREMTRTVFETPKGTLSTLSESAGFTNWQHEKLFKSPDDYKAIRFLIRDEIYDPIYDQVARAQADFGDDAIFRAGIGAEPLQYLISSHVMKMETFCTEWMDNRDEILKLYEALVENRRRIYPIVAQSPLLHANYGGNVVADIIGLENFKKYYVPHYNEAAEIMHKHGKLIGSHLDGNCKMLAEAIAETELDYIEAFTPAPDTDMTLAEARRAWPNKVLWLNFPSSVHLRPDDEVEQTAIDLVNQNGKVDGLIMGITEDMPPDRWQNSCRAIMSGLERHACEKLEWYRI